MTESIGGEVGLVLPELDAVVARLTLGFAAPIPVERIARRLGIAIERSTSQAARGQLVRLRATTAIRLAGPHRSDELTPRQRFTVGHELGHTLLEQIYPGRFDHLHQPGRGGRYWQETEVLCNAIASRLLIPDRLVVSVSQRIRTAHELEIEVRRVSLWSQTSREVATRRLLNHLHLDAFVAEIRHDESPILEWSTERTKDGPTVRRGRQSAVRVPALAEPLVVSASLAVGRCSTTSVPGYTDARLRRVNTRTSLLVATASSGVGRLTR